MPTAWAQFLNSEVSMRSIIILSFIFFATNISTTGQESTELIRRATVKIFNTYVKSNFCYPWKKKDTSSAVGSGAIIKGNLILTNAHVVSDSTFLQIQKENDPTLYTATVLYIGHSCDLALLKVKKTSFFQGTHHLKIGEIPALRSKVYTYGYPKGGERISITEGIVSRIEIGNYYHSNNSSLLRIQTDAAINSGNSGGPVIQNNRIVGVAFQARTDSSNIAYMIPTPIIKHFINDVHDGTYDDFPTLGISASNMYNPHLRNYFGLSKKMSGILISIVYPGSSAYGLLKKDDILLALDNKKLANDGSVSFLKSRIKYTYIIDTKQVGEYITATIFRNKKIKRIKIKLTALTLRIPSHNTYETLPRYFIFGGIIFQPLSREYLKCWNKWYYNADLRMIYYYMYQISDRVTPIRKEFVVINQILPDPINTYLTSVKDVIVKSINGITIKSLKDLPSAFKKPRGKYHIIHIEGTTVPLVLPVTGISTADKRIQSKYNIPHLHQLKKNIRYRK